MKDVISRSPNLVLMIEWSGISMSTKDIRPKREALVKWLFDHKYKFFELIPNPAEKCVLDRFQEMDMTTLLLIDDFSKIKDIWFVPGHMNPNTI